MLPARSPAGANEVWGFTYDLSANSKSPHSPEVQGSTADTDDQWCDPYHQCNQPQRHICTTPVHWQPYYAALSSISSHPSSIICILYFPISSFSLSQNDHEFPSFILESATSGSVATRNQNIIG
jgi:hypothetical protein